MSAADAWFHPALVLFALGSLLGAWLWRRRSLRRALQVFCLNAFVVLLWLAAFDGQPTWPVDLFLFTDPLVALVHTVAGRAVVGLLFVSLASVALAALLGRVFCSHVCPLGTVLDLSDRWLAPAAGALDNRQRLRRWRKLKFVGLLLVVGAAAVGVNLLGYADPMAWLTRSAATVLHPALLALEEIFLWALHPVGSWLDWPELEYLEVGLRLFAGGVVMAALLAALLLLSRLQRRFWCRHLCPLGALLAWAGKWAPYRRRVSDACDRCHHCAKQCPMGAIDLESARSDRSECIVCLSCVRACPHGATVFSFGDREPVAEAAGVTLSRRAFVGAAVGGVVTGLGVRATHASEAHEQPLRPPGAVAEPEFVSRCMRCGECLRACVTNTLQPDWYRAGLDGLWVPHLSLRRGFCQQNCNVCGQVCPTQAIRPLGLVEKRHARIGTAQLRTDRCWPWSRAERCEVCEAQCPYGAIELRARPGQRAPVPVVDPSRCNGCGRCEHACPVDGEAGIVVTNQGELRLSAGSYQTACRERGLAFEPKRGRPAGFDFDGDRLPEGLR